MHDASVPWPDSRKEVPFGTITLTARVDEQEPERRKISFDPLPRVEGIDSSGDPLTEVRADVYLLSGRRRRAAAARLAADDLDAGAGRAGRGAPGFRR